MNHEASFFSHHVPSLAPSGWATSAELRILAEESDDDLGGAEVGAKKD